MKERQHPQLAFRQVAGGAGGIEGPDTMIQAIALGTLGLVMYSVQGASDSVLAGYERLDVSAGAKILYQLTFVLIGAAALLAGSGSFGLIGANLLGIALITWVCWRAARLLGTAPRRADPALWSGLLRASIPFGIIGFATPVDEDHCRVFFWRTRKVQGWQRSVWRFLYRNRLEGLHWHVLEQDRVILENLAPDARGQEFLYQHDQGMARVRKMLEKRARDQVRAAPAAPAAAAE